MPSRRLSPRIRKGDRPLPQRIAVILLAPLLLPRGPPAPAHGRVTTDREALGFDIGADYHLAPGTQLQAYRHTLARQSPRMVLREIGKTAEGRTQLMAIITAPENHKRIARYQEIARRLAHAEGLTDEQAHALAAEGKAVVWIDGGLHATEVLGAHQLMELVYEMATRDDPETRRILNDVVLLAVHANPDGMELVSGWYMREPDTLRRSIDHIPRLYQKYIGHDNNRDFYMVSQPETENLARVMVREWFPQIVYNHHQTGPPGTVLFAPPFRDPFNYHYDPLIPLGIEMVGAAMHARLAAEGKPGATMRSGSLYSTWWNGGLRTTAYFHNMIGLLTETIGNPTPIEIPFIPDRELPKGDMAYPIEPQRWRFRQSIDYSLTMNRAVLDFASRYRETLLYDIYLMGKRSIERGSREGQRPAGHDARAARRRGYRAREVRGVAPRHGPARPAGLHHPCRPAGFPHRDQVRERAHPERDRGRTRDARFRGGRETLPAGVVCDQDRSGVPAPHPRHVRAAGLSQRLRVPRRPAHPAVRQRRLDARLSNGRAVRPHPRCV